MTNIFVQNSDKKLRAVILSRFAADDRTAYANLRVGVLNEIVHLAGMVASIETRILAAELAGEVPGIRGVVNRIEAPGAPSPSRIIHLTPVLKEEGAINDHADPMKGESNENRQDV